MGEHKDFKFGVRIDRTKSQHMEDRLFLKGVWSHSCDPFKIFSPLKISLERLKLETSNFVHWLAT